MADDAVQSLAGLPYFIAFFGMALLLYTLCLALHAALPPLREFRLMREGNVAAAVSLAGALIGYALPMARVLMVSESMTDMLLLSLAALGVQLAATAVPRLMMAPLIRNVVAGQVASGLFLAAMAVAVGILNAAAQTY